MKSTILPSGPLFSFNITTYQITNHSCCRDDPSLDENTRLRNRIAELESLVRELRGLFHPPSIIRFSLKPRFSKGKPHPRWAESNFRDGDPNEKWHSRATKSGPSVKRRGHSPEGPDDQVHENDRGGSGIVPLLAPIKTETTSEVNHPNLYRFSPSPAPSMRYHIFQADARSSPASSYDNEQQCQSYGGGPHSSGGGSSISFHSSPSLPPIQYSNNTRNSARSPFQNSAGSGGNYAFDRCEEDATYVEQYASDMSSRPPSFCPCRTSLATGHVFIALNQQLQNTVNSLRQYNQHPPNSQCVLYRRIVELHSLIQYVFAYSRLSRATPDIIFSSSSLLFFPFSPLRLGGGGDSADGSLGTYDDDISTPTDSDIMTPISASNSFHAPSTGGGPSSQEWQAMAASYSSYFHVHPPQPPPPHGDGQHGIYNVGG
jgi:hypothetical protein